MSVYTRTGDGGTTSLYSKERVSKDDIRVEAYGTVDEASAAMGAARALVACFPWAEACLQTLQSELIDLNADLATYFTEQAAGRITETHVARLEAVIDEMEQRRIPQHYFVTPGESKASAALDVARTIVRRAERRTITLSQKAFVPEADRRYLNRLSDLLFVMARCVEQEEVVQKATAQIIERLTNGQQRPGGSARKEAKTLLDKAKQILEEAEYKAMEIGVPMVIAVVDAGGNLVTQHRMDGSLLASISLALDKAYTAAALKMSTEEAAHLVQPGGPLYGLNTAQQGRFVVFGGGLPLLDGKEVIGGIGVSGGAVHEDVQVANAALAAWKNVRA